jgi:DNA polymerase III psi subunit
MKRTIFIKAWELFRKFEMTFSQALTEAWKLAKRELLIVAFNKIPSLKQYSKKKAAAKTLWQSIETIRYEWRNSINNDGAAAYYGAGRYSGD